MSECFDQETGEIIHSLYRRSDTLGELFAALAKAQDEIAPAEKAGNNPHFNSKFATLGSVIEASRPLAKHGLAVVQMPGNYGSNIAVTTLLGHSSGEWIESLLYVAPGKFDAQGVGSVITYLRRYARMAIVGVAPEDDDGEAAVSKPAQIASRGRTASRSAPGPGVASQAEEERKRARDAYTRLQYAIKTAASDPDALALIYDGASWGGGFRADADLVRHASAESLEVLQAQARHLLGPAVATEADAGEILTK